MSRTREEKHTRRRVKPPKLVDSGHPSLSTTDNSGLAVGGGKAAALFFPKDLMKEPGPCIRNSRKAQKPRPDAKAVSLIRATRFKSFKLLFISPWAMRLDPRYMLLLGVPGSAKGTRAQTWKAHLKEIPGQAGRCFKRPNCKNPDSTKKKGHGIWLWLHMLNHMALALNTGLQATFPRVARSSNAELVTSHTPGFSSLSRTEVKVDGDSVRAYLITAHALCD